jgi:hypothetical protein
MTIPHFRPVDGISILVQAALDAVKNWKAYVLEVAKSIEPPAVLRKSLLSILFTQLSLCSLILSGIVMTIKTIRHQTGGIMAFITEPFSTGMTFPAFVQVYIFSLTVPYHFFSDPPKEFPMMITHVIGFLDAVLIFRIGSLQKGRRVLIVLG